MLSPEHFVAFPAALRRAFPDMSQATADAITAAIGDRPVIIDGEIYVTALGKPYQIPANLWDEN